MKSVFSGDMCIGKNTSQPASVRALRVRRSGLHLLEKMPAFLRSVSSFLDTLKPPRREPWRSGGYRDKYAAGRRRGRSAPAAGAGGTGVHLHGDLHIGGATGHIGRHGHVDGEAVPGGGGVPHGTVGEGGKGDGSAAPAGAAAATGTAAATAAAVGTIAHMSIPQSSFGGAGTAAPPPPHGTAYVRPAPGVTAREKKTRRALRGGLRLSINPAA